MADTATFPWTIEPLDHGRHDRSQFDCGAAVLDDWLRTKSGQFERRDLARVYVLIERGQAVVRGFYAISNHMVVYEALSEDQSRGLPRMDVPVVLLGRLAIDRSVQGKGLGSLLLTDALRRAEYLARKIGIRAVEVHAMNDAAKRFYRKYGFEKLLDDPRHLFLPMSAVRHLKLPPL